jgi:hypothetical protein
MKRIEKSVVTLNVADPRPGRHRPGAGRTVGQRVIGARPQLVQMFAVSLVPVARAARAATVEHRAVQAVEGCPTSPLDQIRHAGAPAWAGTRNHRRCRGRAGEHQVCVETD